MDKIKKFFLTVRFSARDLFFNRKNRRNLTNHEFSIIGNDCVAGCVCKDLKEQMRSPTRNLYFLAGDYLKFCQNLKYYLSLPLTKDKDFDNAACLTALCGDLRLYLVHYDTLGQAQEEWQRRKERVNFDNLFFLMNDRNACKEEHIAAFDALPYPNKVCFTHKEYPQYKSTFYLKGSENEKCLKPLPGFIHQWWFKRYYDEFDFVRWLNTGDRRSKESTSEDT